MNNRLSYEELERKVQLLEQKLEHYTNLKDELDINNSFLKILFNTIPNPMFYKDKNGVYQKCNESFSKLILGIEKEKIIGKSLYEIEEIPKKHADIYKKKDEELFLNPGIQNYTSIVKCADGKERYFDFYKATFMNGNEILGLVGVMLDVTDYKDALNQLKEKNKLLKELTITDPLTKLHNRRYFERVFEEKLNRLNRYNYRFALAIIDIDFFKDYNDNFGHLVGDEILKKVARVIKNTFSRKTDFTFRLGGEEFAVIFKTDNKEDTYSLAEELRKNIENMKIETANNKVSKYLTISIGVADIITQNIKDSTIRKTFNMVDKLLYEAKETGRNKTLYSIY